MKHDDECYWCLGRVRHSPIARVWWHVDSGGEACDLLAHMGDGFRARPRWQ